MDRFELHMCQRRLEQHRGRLRLVMEEELQLAHALQYLFGRRRNEGRIARPGAADPVLAATKLARGLIAATPLGQQHAVNLAEQPQRQWQPFLQHAQTMVEGGDIVAYLPYVIQRHAGFLIQLEQQQVGKRRLRPLDHGGEYRFLADVHIEEQRGVRQQGRNAVQPTEGQQRLVELAAQLRGPIDGRTRRQRRGHEGLGLLSHRRYGHVSALEFSLHPACLEPKIRIAFILSSMHILK